MRALAHLDHQVESAAVIDRAHYVATRVFPMELVAGASFESYWDDYLLVYAAELGVDAEDLDSAVTRLRDEYLSGGLWREVIAGSREGLQDLVATGVRVGVVSNSDGSVESRLRSQNILQVGEGTGVEVGCVIDSGIVGVSKPDRRIFELALDALGVTAEEAWYVGDTPAFDVVGARRAGIHPILMDPFRVNQDVGVCCVHSLQEVADLVRRTS